MKNNNETIETLVPKLNKSFKTIDKTFKDIKEVLEAHNDFTDKVNQYINLDMKVDNKVKKILNGHNEYFNNLGKVILSQQKKINSLIESNNNVVTRFKDLEQKEKIITDNFKAIEANTNYQQKQIDALLKILNRVGAVVYDIREQTKERINVSNNNLIEIEDRLCNLENKKDNKE